MLISFPCKTSTLVNTKFKMVNQLIKKLKNYSEIKLVLIFFISSLILRFAYAIYVFLKQPLDENNAYFLLAKKIVEQGAAFYETSSDYLDATGPGLPWINAITMFIFGENWLGIFFITSVISSLITVFIFKVALLATDKATASFAALWSSVYIFYIMFSASAGKDLWMAFLLIVIIYLLLRLFYKKQFSIFGFVLLLVIFVFSFHLDERLFIFSPFIFFYILCSETKKFSSFRITKSFSFFIGIILLMLPWGIRNYKRYNKIVIISTRTERLTDKIFGYRPRQNVLDGAYELKSEYYIHDYQIDSVLNGTKTITDYGYEISKAQREFMHKGNLPKPFTPKEAFFSRIFSMLRPVQFGGNWERSGYYYYEKSRKHNIVSFLFYGIILFFSFPGFYFLYKKNKNVFYLFIITIFIYTMIHVLTIPYTNWRYRLPLDSIFIIVGCFGLTKLIENRYKKVSSIEL
jgi:4-amino-4-deoxy-L-arabinose transferase-like glycosyltransferase